MTSRAPGLIHIKFDHLSIKNQLNNGPKSSRLDSYGIHWLFNKESIKELPQELQAWFLWNSITFQLRINWRMAPRAPGWIHMEFNDCSIKNQWQNGFKSSRLDSYEVWSFFNEESIKESYQELQTGFVWNLIIFN